MRVKEKETKPPVDLTKFSVTTKASMLRKSHSGCRDCRRRKVKCDESKPVCSNCRRRYIGIQRCDWSAETHRKGVHVAASAPQKQIRGNVRMKSVTSYSGEPSPSSLPLHAGLDGSDGQWRALELCLMHHYTTVVCLTMPHSVTADTQMWQQIIPQLSFESETVLNPMLALSALHRHMYLPKDTFVAKALQRYLDRALVHHRLELSSRNELSPQLWLSAIMLSHIYWLISHRQHENEVYDIPIQVFKMLEATNRLFASKKRVLKQLGYGWIGDGATPETVLEERLPVAAQEQLRAVKMELTQLLDAFNVIEMQDDERSILMQAKDYVFKCYQAYYSGATVATLRPFVGFMPINCSSEYLEMLGRHDPPAMALISLVERTRSCLVVEWIWCI